jgi:hypothetical protein
MKCLKSEKTGNIIRVTDQQAYNMVGREWQYVAKSEWKALTREKTEQQEVQEQKKEKTISKKAARRKQIKEKQRQD